MRRTGSGYCIIIALVLILSPGLKAQETNKVNFSLGADIVSSYIWRGLDCGNVSIQPWASIEAKGFSLMAWGSTGLERSDIKNFDWILEYETGGFSIAITDYWLDYEEGTRYFEYGAHTTAHTFEATVGYDFGPVSLSWSTYFAGDDCIKENGKRAYSSYAEAIVPFTLGEFKFAAEIGFTPWEGDYASSFNVVNIALAAGKDLKITNSFNLPIFTKLVFNPNRDKAFFVFGVCF